MEDLILYKTLLNTLESYVERFPRTETTGILEKCINKGISVIPVDETKLKLLEEVLLGDKTVPSKVHYLRGNLSLLNL